MLDLSIVLPTYNEAKNVKILTERIIEAMKPTKRLYEIVFVDDSDDETPKIIEKITKKYSFVRLVHREKEDRTGLATAFMKGFQVAQGKYICCMDSDLQHPPGKIIVLLEEIISENSDIVVASRYTKGGNAKGLDGFYRKLVSIGLSYFVQIIFPPTRKTTDPGSGFFVFRKKILDGVRLQPQGFKILIEILTKTRYKRVTQVPYTFLPRENDQSKANFSQGIKFLKHLWNIFLTSPEAGRFIKFFLVGFSGVIVNLGLLYIFVEKLDFTRNFSWIIAVLVSIANNYTLNTVFTYSDRRARNYKESIKRLGQYYFISLALVGLNFFIYRSGMHWGAHYIVAAFVGILFTTIINFVLVMKIVWKEDERSISGSGLFLKEN